eukprot:COSAG01_NODE_66415_length_270_cov_0.608187_1_plen_45_part_01
MPRLLTQELALGIKDPWPLVRLLLAQAEHTPATTTVFGLLLVEPC